MKRHHAAGRSLRPAFLCCALVAAAAGPAAAQDALAGKRLYLDAARVRATGISCVDCHGALPGGAFGIGRSANDAVAVERAVNSIPQMTPFRGRLLGTDYADLAAFIGRPDVPSPQVRSTTFGPAARGPERLQFAAPAAGTASAPSRWQIANDGAVPMRITGAVTLRGAAAADFTVTATDCTAGRTLGPGESCGVDLAFRPTESGERVAAAAVPHDWVRGETALALQGTGEPVGSASPAVPTTPAAPAAPATTPPVGASGGGAAGPGWLALLALLSWWRHRRPASSAVACRPPPP